MVNLKSKRGISLIVLVITIIVMIILAAAIILSLNSSGIIGKANKAKIDSDTANIKEYVSTLKAEWELMNDKSEYENFAEYANKVLAEKGYAEKGIAVAPDETVYTNLSESAMKVIKAGTKVGAQVTGFVATPDSNTYTTSGNERTGTNYDGSKVTGSSQTLKTDVNLTWKYGGIDDNGNIIIVSDIPTTVLDTSKLVLGYEGGCLNGPKTLNDICSALYKSNKGTARNMNMDDVNRILQYDGPKGVYGSYINPGEDITTIEPMTIGEIVEQKGEPMSSSYLHTPDGQNSWDNLKTYKSDECYIRSTSPYIHATQDAKNIVYQSNTYWLASPCTYAYFNNTLVVFRIRCVTSTQVGQDYAMFDTYASHTGKKTCALRPVVALNSNVALTATADGITLT